MRTSVLKANEKAALKCWSDFQSINENEGWKSKGVEFIKKELTSDANGAPLKDGSFEIRYTKVIDGVRKGKAIFRFLKKRNRQCDSVG
jgi:hypothetical protein